MSLVENAAGGYRFLRGIAPYSAGVAALPGYEVVRAVFHAPPPYLAGFERAAALLEGLGRPKAALCAIELRIPEPLSFAGFAAFNAEYRGLLESWDLIVDGANPLARTNVAPAIRPPAEPVLYAFSYTLPADAPPPRPTFVVAGAGDLSDQARLEEAAIVRPGETSDDAMREKAAVVMDTMQERLFGLGMAWEDVTAVGVYSARQLDPLVEESILSRAARPGGHDVSWFYSRPPISGLEFEMDLRGVWREARL